jgi:hypothetical protein
MLSFGAFPVATQKTIKLYFYKKFVQNVHRKTPEKSPVRKCYVLFRPTLFVMTFTSKLLQKTVLLLIINLHTTPIIPKAFKKQCEGQYKRRNQINRQHLKLIA